MENKDTLILGVHVAIKSKVLDDQKAAKSMSIAISRDLNTLGLNAAQIFTHGPTKFTPNNIDINEVKNVCQNIDLTVHSPYPAVGIWSIVNDAAAVRKRKLTIFENQLKACKDIEAWGLVLHINKIPPSQVAAVMQYVKPLAKRHGITILLEMIANKANANTYETPEKINNLITLLDHKEDYYGFTIDTAHIWGAGVDITNKTTMEEWFNNITHKNKIKQIHLNGSYADCGSGKDKHAIPFVSYDKIWANVDPNQSGVKAVIAFAKRHAIPIICEINRGTETEVRAALTILQSL